MNIEQLFFKITQTNRSSTPSSSKYNSNFLKTFSASKSPKKKLKPKQFRNLEEAADFLKTHSPNKKVYDFSEKITVKHFVKADHDISRSLGPGKYPTSTHSKTPSFKFSNLPRFQDSQNTHFFVFKNKNKSFEIIQKNKKLEDLNPIRRKEISEQKRKEKSFREFHNKEKARIKRTLIKNQREQKIKEKFRKLEIRQNLAEYTLVKRSWVVFACVFAANNRIKTKLKDKKALLKRIGNRIRCLKVNCMVLGKLKIKLKQVRVKRAWSCFRSKLRPYLKRWKLEVKHKCAYRVTELLENSLMKSHMFNVMYQYRTKILTTRRQLFNYIMIKRSRIDTLEKLWEQLEYQNIKARRKITEQGTPVKLIVPSSIRKYYVREIYAKKIISFLKSVREGNQTNLILYKDKEFILEFIKKAEELRSEWETIAKKRISKRISRRQNTLTSKK